MLFSIISLVDRKLHLFQGERSFFLMPGERLERGIQNVYVLGEDEGLILKATETFQDEEDVSYKHVIFSNVAGLVAG